MLVIHNIFKIYPTQICGSILHIWIHTHTHRAFMQRVSALKSCICIKITSNVVLKFRILKQCIYAYLTELILWLLLEYGLFWSQFRESSWQTWDNTQLIYVEGIPRSQLEVLSLLNFYVFSLEMLLALEIVPILQLNQNTYFAIEILITGILPLYIEISKYCGGSKEG